MNNYLIRSAQYLIFAGILLVPGQWARAQEQGVTDALEVITVTARRREEPLMTTPVSITAFTAQELKARLIEQSSQVAEATPNLVYRNVTNSSNVGGSIFIRGIGQGDWVPTVQPGVGVYMDGSYVARINGSLAQVVDIESVQVLRGPQGTLFGRNTIGGALLLTTVKPNNEFGGYIDAKVGSFDMVQVKGSVNVPFTDNFFGRFAIIYRNKNGYIDTPNYINVGKFPGDDTIGGRVALRWLMTESVTADWSAEYFEHESEGPPMVLDAIFPNVPGNNVFVYNNVTAPTLGLPTVGTEYALGRDSYTNLGTAEIGGQKAEIFNTTLTLAWNITDDLTLKSITNYRDMDTLEYRDGDATPGNTTYFQTPITSDQFTQEFNLSSTLLDERLTWLLGAYYFQENTVNASPSGFPTFSLVSGAKVDNESKAVFGQATYELTERASFTFGARYTDEDLKSTIDDTNQHITQWLCTATNAAPFCPTGFVGFLDIPPPPAPGSIRIVPNGVFVSKETRPDYYFNLAYQFTDTLMSYISYSEGFKGGGFTQRVRPGGVPKTFGPEFAEVIEWGVKWSGLNDQLRLTGAIFTTDYQDLQVPVTSLFGVNIQNAGEAEINGGEIEMMANLTDRWQISMGLGYLDGKYKELRPGVTFSANNLLPSVAEWQSNASIVYSLPAPGVSGNIVTRLDYSYLGSHFTNAANTPGTEVPGRSLLNGAITYFNDSEKWELALEVRNITDELVIQEMFGDRVANGFITPVISPPREWAIRVRYHFL